ANCWAFRLPSCCGSPFQDPGSRSVSSARCRRSVAQQLEPLLRVLGEVSEERLELLRDADAIVQEEVQAAGLERELWQAFAVLLPVRTVGVMGDFRTYAQVIALRAVMSQDAMTAASARLPYELLGRISNRIINEVKGVNRVVFDISSKPPSTI